MRILLINDYGTPTGGAEYMMLGLREVYRTHGHQVCLFSSNAQPLPVPIEADEVCLGTTTRFRTLLQSTNPWAAYRLRQVLDHFKPDVAHVRLFLTQLSPAILPLLRALPTVLHLADYRPICPVGRKQLPQGSACHFSAGWACYKEGCLPLRDWVPLILQMRMWERRKNTFDYVVANSHWVAERMLQEGLVADTVIWNGVLERPARTSLAPAPVVAFAGRLVPGKGVEVLLEAMHRVAARCPNAVLLLAGEGPIRPALERQIADLGLEEHVRMLGHLSREAMEKAFSPAWVQAIPSTWEEPFGIVAAEAMMRGTAVVASRIGGLSEIVLDGEVGYTVPPGDASALAEALLHLLNDASHAEAMGAAGRQRALQAFNITDVAERFLMLYEDLLSSPDGPPSV